MADIKLYQLPTAGAVSDADLLHISQSNQDYQITIANLADKFGEVNIFDLTIGTPTSSNWIAMSDSSGVIANNRRVTFDSISALLQENQYYADTASVTLADEIVVRVGGGNSLTQTTVQAMRNRVLDFTDGFTTATSLSTNDRVVVHDSTAGENQVITSSNLRLSILDPAALNTLTTLDNADLLQVYDSSAGQAKKITYANLETQIIGSAGLGSYVPIAGNTDVTGNKSFTSGLTTNSIGVYNAATTLNLSHSTVAAANTITAVTVDSTYLEGSFLGDRGDANQYINSAVQTIYPNAGSDQIDANIFEVKCDGLMPSDNGGTFLGQNSKQWDEIHGDRIYGDSIQSTGIVAGSTLYAGGYIAFGGYVVRDALPRSTPTTGYGAVQIAGGITYEGTQWEASGYNDVVSLTGIQDQKREVVNDPIGSSQATTATAAQNSAGTPITVYPFWSAAKLQFGRAWGQVAGVVTMNETYFSGANFVSARAWEITVDIRAATGLYIYNAQNRYAITVTGMNNNTTQYSSPVTVKSMGGSGALGNYSTITFQCANFTGVTSFSFNIVRLF